MLDSVKIARRQSEIRQQLAELVGKEKPSEDETRQMDTLDGEYRTNETRYRAALVSEDARRITHEWVIQQAIARRRLARNFFDSKRRTETHQTWDDTPPLEVNLHFCVVASLMRTGSADAGNFAYLDY